MTKKRYVVTKSTGIGEYFENPYSKVKEFSNKEEAKEYCDKLNSREPMRYKKANEEIEKWRKENEDRLCKLDPPHKVPATGEMVQGKTCSSEYYNHEVPSGYYYNMYNYRVFDRETQNVNFEGEEGEDDGFNSFLGRVETAFNTKLHKVEFDEVRTPGLPEQPKRRINKKQSKNYDDIREGPRTSGLPE